MIVWFQPNGMTVIFYSDITWELNELELIFIICCYEMYLTYFCAIHCESSHVPV